ncbi:MAG: SEC-C metal-binding domain-containing protein [Proteobacteria bacterium]|nr:SEC-C metal-binding domain-containing protein [Pseudomonadota bacterium]
MAKPGRVVSQTRLRHDDRCPCGSGKKYKSCCLTKDEAAEREQLTKAQAARDERAAEKRQSLREVRETLMAKLSGSEIPEDDLDAASNAVIDLIRAGKLDDAEAAARDLLVRYPEVPDGWERLGIVYEKRGENRQAADCYRKVADFIRQQPDGFEADAADEYAARAAKLDPTSAG